MILPSLNAFNCENTLRVKTTIPSGNEMANRKTVFLGNPDNMVGVSVENDSNFLGTKPRLGKYLDGAQRNNFSLVTFNPELLHIIKNESLTYPIMIGKFQQRWVNSVACSKFVSGNEEVF